MKRVTRKCKSERERTEEKQKQAETKRAKWGFTVKRKKKFSFLKSNSATFVYE